MSVFNKGVSQDAYTLDSIRTFIDTTSSEEERLHYIIELSTHYWYIDADSGLQIVYGAKEELNKLLSKEANQPIWKKLMGDALNSEGVLNYIQGDFPKALHCFESCRNIALEVDDSARLASANNNLGLIQNRLKNYDAALKSYQAAYDLFYDQGEWHQAGTALQNISTVYSKQKNYKKALEVMEKCLALFEKSGIEYKIVIAKYNIGLVHANLKNYRQAETVLVPNLEEALKQGNLFLAGMHHVTLGEVYMATQRFEQSLKHWEDALDLINKSKAVQRLPEVYLGLSMIHDSLGMPVRAYRYYKLYNELQDSILAEEKIEEVATMRLQFEFNRERLKDSLVHMEEQQAKQLEIEKQRRDIERRELIQYVSLGGILVLGLVAFMAIRAYRSGRRKNLIISEQKEIVEEKNKEILDSITYAKRIQNAILPPNERVENLLPESFIIYKPKDIVAGDFYWLEEKNGVIMFAACDCTGHGVPGAMVSVVCNNGLNRSVREHNLTKPADILDMTRKIVVEEFSKSQEEVKDGMDVALCALSQGEEGVVVEFAGAHNPLWIIRNGSNELEEIRGDKQPIGAFEYGESFRNHRLSVSKGDMLYVFSDGFSDQFGGEKGKKFKASNFKKLLLSISSKPVGEQKLVIEQAFEEWKGEYEQLDDVCVMGIRI